MGLFSALVEERASPEGSRPLTAASLLDILGGSPTATGKRISEEGALKIAVVYSCVRVLAESEAALPLPVYRRLEPRGKERAPEHPLYSILHDAPNPWMTSMVFRETLMGHVLLWGNAFAEIMRDENANITGLFPLRPDRMERPTLAASGDLLYRYTLPSGEPKLLPKANVMHIPALSSDGIWGYSPIGLLRESLGLTATYEEYAGRFFGNSAAPRGVLQAKGILSEDAAKRIAASWNAQHQGLDNAHRVAVLEEGVEWKQVGMPLHDAQFLDGRQFQRSEIPGAFRVPAHMVNDLTHATFCLPADALVYTEGGPKRIADVRVHDYVWSLDTDGKWVQSRVVRSAPTGFDEILTIRTTNRTLRLNGRHRVLARRRSIVRTPVAVATPIEHVRIRPVVEWHNEWVQAADLRVGDTIVTLGALPNRGWREAPTRTATVGFMEFCGLFLGDGNLMRGKTSKGVAIARSARAPYMDHYREIIRREFVKSVGGGRGDFTTRGTAPVILQEQERTTRVSSKLAYTEMEILGFSGTAHEKRVPSWIFRLDDELKLAFLRGYLDADGSVDKLGRISFSSCNQPMLADIRHLCMGLGIPVTNLRLQCGQTKLPNGRIIGFEQYSFVCSDPGRNRLIGSHTPEYIHRMEAGKPFDKKERNYPRYGGRGFESGPCELARIASIERQQVVEPVYDLEVEGTHSFIADGVVVHNSNVEHLSLDFVVHSLRPWLVRIEQEILRSLLTPAERRLYFAEHLVDGLLRGDSAARGQYYRELSNIGALSPNDIREMENRNPIEGGDQYLVNLTMTPLDKIGELPPPQDTPGPRNMRPLIERRDVDEDKRLQLRELYEPLIEAAFQPFVEQQARAIAEQLGHLAERSAESFENWLEQYNAELTRRMETPLLRLLAAYGHAVEQQVFADLGFAGAVESSDPFTQRYVDNLTRSYMGRTTGKLQKVIADAATAGTDPVDAVRKQLAEWESTRAKMIAKLEAVGAGEAYARNAYRKAGVRRLMWRSRGTACTYCSRLNGKIVSIEENFQDKGSEIDGGEGQPVLKVKRHMKHPPAHSPSCRCMIVPA